MGNLKALILSAFVLAPVIAQAQTTQVNVSLSPDKRSLLITSKTCVTELQFSGDAIDPLIARIGELRASMTPPIPTDPITATLVNPGRFHLGPNQSNNGFVVAIFHPGFGWIGMNMSTAEAEQLEKELQKIHNPAQ